MRYKEAQLIDWPERMERLGEKIRAKNDLFSELTWRVEYFEMAAKELDLHQETRAATVLRNKAIMFQNEAYEVNGDIITLEAELREMPVKAAKAKEDDDAAANRAYERSV